MDAQQPIPPELTEFAGRMYDAARRGDMPIFQQALPAGLPANLTNEKGDTLVRVLQWRSVNDAGMKLTVFLQLMLAAYHGHAELVTLMLQHGADPDRLNDRGQSPLAGAVFKKEDAVIEVSFPRNPDCPTRLGTVLSRRRRSSKAARTPSTGTPARCSA